MLSLHTQWQKVLPMRAKLVIIGTGAMLTKAVVTDPNFAGIMKKANIIPINLPDEVLYLTDLEINAPSQRNSMFDVSIYRHGVFPLGRTYGNGFYKWHYDGEAQNSKAPLIMGANRGAPTNVTLYFTNNSEECVMVTTTIPISGFTSPQIAKSLRPGNRFRVTFQPGVEPFKYVIHPLPEGQS